eukprot:6212875-Pleurochrysis_carterae.AAC.1
MASKGLDGRLSPLAARFVERRYHPDKNPTDREAAEAKFKLVAEAYESKSAAWTQLGRMQCRRLLDLGVIAFAHQLPAVANFVMQVLSDEDKRRRYDAGEDLSGNEEQQQQQGQRTGWMHHGGQHVHVRFG